MKLATIWLALLESALALPSSYVTHNSSSAASTSDVGCGLQKVSILFNEVQSKETVINKACAALMPKCAYPENNPELDCPEVGTYELNSSQETSVNDITVLDLPRGNTSTTTALWFVGAGEATVWTRADCYRNFNDIFSDSSTKTCLDEFEDVRPEGYTAADGLYIPNSVAVTDGANMKDTLFWVDVTL